MWVQDPDGTSWGLLETGGTSWGSLEAGGACWGLLETSGACWGLSEAGGSEPTQISSWMTQWTLLTASSNSTKSLAKATACTHQQVAMMARKIPSLPHTGNSSQHPLPSLPLRNSHGWVAYHFSWLAVHQAIHLTWYLLMSLTTGMLFFEYFQPFSHFPTSHGQGSVDRHRSGWKRTVVLIHSTSNLWESIMGL